MKIIIDNINKNIINNNVLKTLGLAFRAGKIITGDDAVTKALCSNKLKIVFIASDASDGTKDKYEKKCFFYNVEVNFDYTCEQISNAVGKPMRKIIGLIDEGFYQILRKQKRGENL